jgi:hypothetical protein
MKPVTFANYIVQEQESIMEGWVSGAAFEVHVQVIFDKIVRKHLSNKVAVYEDDQGGKFLGQQSGKSALGGLVPVSQVDYTEWSRMREIRYTESTKISDLMVTNERGVPDPGVTDGVCFKGTYYWIELKVESPVPTYKDFGGKSPVDALNEDVTKLKAQKAADEKMGVINGNTFQKRRYWYVMLAFSDARRGFVKSLKCNWSVAGEFVHKYGSMVVCILEV